MKTFMKSLMACAVLCMMCTSAFADGGGGGAKGDVTTTVLNQTDLPASVNPAVMVVGVGPLPGTITQFLAGGAQFIPPGGSVTFSTPPGTITLSAIFILDAGGTSLDTDAINVAGGTTVAGVGNVVVPNTALIVAP